MKTNFLKYCLMAVSAVSGPIYKRLCSRLCPQGGWSCSSLAPGSVTGGEAMRDAMLLAERDVNAAGGFGL